MILIDFHGNAFYSHFLHSFSFLGLDNIYGIFSVVGHSSAQVFQFSKASFLN